MLKLTFMFGIGLLGFGLALNMLTGSLGPVALGTMACVGSYVVWRTGA